MLLFACISLCPLRAQQDTSSITRDDLRGVLIQARDAIIQVSAEDTSSLDTRISEQVRDLVDAFLYIGDQKDIRYLQKHLKKAYGDEIKNALEPPPSFDEALANASRQHSSMERTDALAAVAVKQYQQGNTSEGNRAVELAIQAGSEPQDTAQAYPFGAPPEEKLLGAASMLQEGGFGDAADTVLWRLKKILDSSAHSGWSWRKLAESAISAGNLELAREAINNVGDEEGRAEMEERLQAAQSITLAPDAALRSASLINDVERRIRALHSIASRQVANGDHRGASVTLKLATDAALSEEDDTFQVFQLNDIAWVLIDNEDRDEAERIVELALHANEKHRWGSDQVNGWVVLAETLAYLGHFEKAWTTATKSDDASFRGEGFKWVAYHQTLAGDKAEALRRTDRLKDANERSGALLGVAKAMVDRLKGEHTK